MGIIPAEAPAGFCVCLEEVPSPRPRPPSRLTTTQFRRPVLTDAVCNAKAGCLYPNNARMLAEARAERVTTTCWWPMRWATWPKRARPTCSWCAMDGELHARSPTAPSSTGSRVSATSPTSAPPGSRWSKRCSTFEEFRKADEVFMTGNLNKVTPVVEFDGTHYQRGPIAEKARDLYWAWARSDAG
jgi:branched-chain amino acid aminotransferase